MLRIGLTGELGSGKSTVARLLAERGALVLSSDEMGRAMMQPGLPVYQAIVAHFGPAVVLPDGSLNRRALAAIAFDPSHPRIEELNALVHPPVIAEQEHLLAEIARNQPEAIVVIESALLFTTRHAGGEQPWRRRFDRILLVTAPDAVKIERYIKRVAADRPLSEPERTALRSDAEVRLAAQRIPPEAARDCLHIANDDGIAALECEVDRVWSLIQSANRSAHAS